MSKINGEFIDLTADPSTDTVITVQNIVDPMWSSSMLPSPIPVDVYDEQGRIMTLDSATSTDAVAPLGPASIAPQESASSSNEVAFLLPVENGINLEDLLGSQQMFSMRPCCLLNDSIYVLCCVSSLCCGVYMLCTMVRIYLSPPSFEDIIHW